METNKRFALDDNSIDIFLNSKKLSGWSDLMINRTRRRLAVFCADFSEDNLIVKNSFENWKVKLKQSGLSERTINEYVSVATQFMAYVGFSEEEFVKTKGLDLTGRQFGNLKVLRKAGGRKSSERSFIWECQCICGKIVEIPANQLTKGFHTSCGCQRAERLKEANQYIEGTSLKMVFSDTIRKDNTSGYKGIYQKNGRWAARIQYKGKRYYLGAFDKLEEAVSVRKEAEEKIRGEAKLLIYEQ